MATTYNSLLQDALSYLERSDESTVSQMPLFISNAQERLARESKNIGLETYVTGNFTPGVCVYPKPANWRRNITFNFGSGAANNVRNPIELRVYEYLVAYWPDRTQTGVPKFYSDYTYDRLLIAPTPDLAYPYEFGLLQIPTQITPANQTNWWTNYAPDVLLNATVLEALYYLKNYESIPVWKERYETSLASLNGQDDLRVNDRQTDRGAD